MRLPARSRCASKPWATAITISRACCPTITSYHALTEADGWICLAAPTEAVMHTLQLVGVDALIDCRETLRHALGN
ncbi:hypothetical protein [Streptomyces sp. NPDC057438]|uniref:hypothetical protein n=1 Tax=Streptomyces sp. NPDC057438 TaxID=3346133 RepID=UPI00368B7070